MLRFFRAQALTLGVAVIALALVATGRVTPAAARAAIDFDLLLVLYALLITVEILRVSGYLDLAVAATVSRFTHTRPFAFALVALSGVLATLLTNDVTLFIVIPFTIAASRFSAFDVEHAVVLEVIAANLIGCLTPLGNPQNLFVFHRSGWSAVTFVRTMLPFVACSALGLVIATFFLGASRALVKTKVDLPPRLPRVALAGAVCFALVALEIARLIPAWPSAVAATIAAALFLRRHVLDIDFSIVPLFFFTFVIVAGLRTLPIARLGDQTYVSAIVLSQAISNVPATLLLSPFAAGAWKTLLYGANAGGCGTIVASLANLLGWRIYVRETRGNGHPRFAFHLQAISFAFLAWIGPIGWFLLR